VELFKGQIPSFTHSISGQVSAVNHNYDINSILKYAKCILTKLLSKQVSNATT